MPKEKGPQRGSKRVEQWVHAVLNPWVEALPREIALLGRKNPTWRHYSRELELIRPMELYLSPLFRLALRDLRRARKEVARPVDRHDDLVKELEVAAGAAHDSLLSQPKFVDLVKERVRVYQSTPRRYPEPAGALPLERFPSLVAEHLVNNIQEIPADYTDSEFWKLYVEDFRALAAGPAFATLAGAIQELHRHDVKLNQEVGDWAFRLCEEFDVPAAPEDRL